MVFWIRQVAAEVIRSGQILDLFEDTAHNISCRLDLEYEGGEKIIITPILHMKLTEDHGNKVPHQQILKVEYKYLMYSHSNSIVISNAP